MKWHPRHFDGWRASLILAWLAIAFALFGLYLVNQRATSRARSDFRRGFLANCKADDNARRFASENRDTMRAILDDAASRALARIKRDEAAGLITAAVADDQRAAVRDATTAEKKRIKGDVPRRHCKAELALAERKPMEGDAP